MTARNTLPPELRSAIMTLCSDDSLPRLALVSKEFQILAEKLLYAAVVIRTYSGQIRALATLAASTTRASYVKFLSVESYTNPQDTDASVMEWFYTAAPGMRNLKDLRLSLRQELKRTDLNSMDDLLSCGCFQLECLFINPSFDLVKIVEAQKDLNFLAVRGDDTGVASLVSVLETRHLVAVSMDRETYLPVYNNIFLAPDLLSLEQAQNFDTLFRQYSASDSMASIKMNLHRVTTAVIHLETSPSQPIFRAFLKSAAKAFPNLCEIEFRVECSLRMEWEKISLEEFSVSKIEVSKWDREGKKERDCGRVFVGSTKDFALWVHNY